MCIHGNAFPCQFGCVSFSTSPPWGFWWPPPPPIRFYPMEGSGQTLHFFPDPAPWKCPACGVGVAPSEKVCPQCVEKKKEGR